MSPTFLAVWSDVPELTRDCPLLERHSAGDGLSMWLKSSRAKLFTISLGAKFSYEVHQVRSSPLFPHKEALNKFCQWCFFSNGMRSKHSIIWKKNSIT